MLQQLRFTPWIAAALAVGLGACSTDSPLGPEASETAAAQRTATATAPAPRVARLETSYMKFVVDHHTMGILMAQVCVNKARHAPLRELCRESIAAQQRERRQLQTWLREWYGIHYDPQLTPSDRKMVESLRQLSGARFEIRFLHVFPEHHAPVIQRSEPIIRRAFHSRLRQLAAGIIRAQSVDSARMRSWLCIWYRRCDHIP